VIRMGSLKRRIPRPSLTIAVVAAFLAVAASATAASLITGQQIKNGSITGADVKRGSLGASDLSRAAKRKLRGRRGPAGPPGPSGPRGPSGSPGLGRVLTAEAGDVAIAGGTGLEPVLEIVLPAGSFAVDATLLVRSPGSNDVCELRSAKGLLEQIEFTAGTAGVQIQLQGEFESVSQAGRVRISCGADDQLLVRTARIRAIEAGEIG
jgi:hypothetical protein